MMTDFTGAMRTHLTDETAILALEWIGTGTTRRTLLGYARTIRASSRRFQTELMDAFIAGLAVMAAQEPLRQAGLLSKEEVRRIIVAAPPDAKWLIWVTFLTASRWGDTQGLSSSKLLFSPTQITVDFQGVTKASKKRPHRIDHLVAIPGTVDGAQGFQEWVLRTPVWPKFTTTQITTLMRRVLQRTDVTAHSLKRTALGLLLRAASRGFITMKMVAQMGKHLGLEPTLPEVTVQYLQDRKLLAATNGSARAVSLLDLGLRIPFLEGTVLEGEPVLSHLDQDASQIEPHEFQ
jgi:integrase